MNVLQRIEILENLGNYILSDEPAWLAVKERAYQQNNWFVPPFIDASVKAIAQQFLRRDVLEKVVASYAIPTQLAVPRTVGIVMAGNLPLVGFHDFCCTFLSGHRACIKSASQDNVLLPHLVDTICAWEPAAKSSIHFAEMLKGCDKYIATGSNQSSVYFQHYFGKYPNIIRRNRTAVALLTGQENNIALDALADDVHLYFGRGCRSVTHLFVPRGYDFHPLLESFNRYAWLSDHHKYKNNYDYQLALLIINNQFYMTNGSVLLYEHPAFFAPIGRIHYTFYDDLQIGKQAIQQHPDIQCVAGEGYLPFGTTQLPGFTDYADGIDTLQFLLTH